MLVWCQKSSNRMEAGLNITSCQSKILVRWCGAKIWDTSSVVDPGVNRCFGHYHHTPSPEGGPDGIDHVPLCVPHPIEVIPIGSQLVCQADGRSESGKKS